MTPTRDLLPLFLSMWQISFKPDHIWVGTPFAALELCFLSPVLSRYALEAGWRLYWGFNWDARPDDYVYTHEHSCVRRISAVRSRVNLVPGDPA